MSAAPGAAVSQRSPRSLRLAHAAMWLSTAGLAALAIWNLWRLSPIVSDVPFQHRMEGAVVRAGLEILELRNPYTDPVGDAALTFMYPPVGSVLLAVAWKAGGGGFFWPRALSFVGVLATAYLLGWDAWRRRGPTAGIWAASAWIAFLGIFHEYLPWARVDSVAIALMTAAFVAGRRSMDRRRGFVWAALLAVAAAFAKQPAAAVAIGMLVSLLLLPERRGWLVYAATACAASLALGGALHLASGGWSTRTILLGARHPIVPALALECATDFLLRPHALAIALLSGFALRDRWRFDAPALAAAAILCFLTSAKLGGGINGMAPAVALWIAAAASALPPLGSDGPLALRAKALALLLLPASLAQAEWSLPSRAQRAESLAAQGPGAEELLRLVRAQRGPMLTSGYQEYSLLSGIPIANDASVAYDYDLGGAPALERVISGVEHKEYGFMALPEMGGLEETAALCRGLGRAETADRIDRLSRAVDANYRPIRPGTFLFVPRE